MSSDLQQLLEQADGGPFGPPDLDAIERRSRRLRTARAAQWAGGVVVVLAVLAIAVAAVLTGGPEIEIVGIPPEPTTSVVDGIVVDTAPGVSEMAQLERLDTVLPDTLQLDVDHVLPLSTAPVERAVALSRRLDLTGGGESAVFVVGADGQTRLIDLANLRLVGDVDPQVIHSVETLSTTLSPDGTRAAFIHRDEQVADGVLVVDLTAAEARHYPIAEPLGFHSRVIWHPDGQQLVIEDHEQEQTLLLDLTTGQIRVESHGDPTDAYGGLGLVATTHAPDRDIVRLSGAREDDPALSRWTPNGGLVERHPLPATSLAPHGWDWGTPGWRHGNLVARTQRVGPRWEEGPVVFVFDLESGEVVRALHLPAHETTPEGEGVFRRGVDDSPVLGWLDADTVLIADGGVTAWNVRTGQLSLVAQVHDGPEGTPIGYDTVGDLQP